MLSHLNRFHGHGSLRYVYTHGRSVRGRFLMIKTIQNKKRVHSRVAVVVSKKIYKSAVKRNRIRRRIYEIIRFYLPLITEPHDIVITVIDKTIKDTPHEELKQQIADLLEKESLIR